jgi:cell fate regulator YaaT (PSP1 superfamily)
MAYVVRYGRMRFLGEYAGPEDQDHFRGQRVVLRTDRGTELGEVLCPATERTASYLEQSVPGEILRPATDEDLEQEAQLIQAQKKAFDVCQALISRRRLQMDLVDVEIILGRERIVFYYLAEKRVDFRELVKDLARALRTRIEMRQIGVRDEAKLLADYGDCGKPVCCNTHLTAMPPVSMKMAKLQKTTLDPAKISGRCGRLKCCLRYEFDTYRELERQLPAVGTQVVTSKGRGRVVGQEILAQKLVVEYEDHRRIIVGPDDVLSVEPARIRQAQADERTGPTSGRSHRDGLEDQSLQGIESDHAAWSDDGSIDEAEPETQAEDGNDLGPDRRDRRGGRSAHEPT